MLLEPLAAEQQIATACLYLSAVKNVRAGPHSCVMKGIICALLGFLFLFLEKCQVGTQSLKAPRWEHVVEIQAKESGRNSIYLDKTRLGGAAVVPRRGKLDMLAGWM